MEARWSCVLAGLLWLTMCVGGDRMLDMVTETWTFENSPEFSV